MPKIRFILLIVFICCLSKNAIAQQMNIGINTGIGTYKMRGLKNLNKMVQESLPFESKITSNFPAYFYYEPYLSASYDYFSLGILSSFYSTGSRISSKDYSGEYLFDTRIRSLSPGLFFELNLFTLNEKLYLMTLIKGGYLFSELKLREHLSLNKEVFTNETYRFTAGNYYIEPGVKLLYRLCNFIETGVNFDYFVQFGKKPLLNKDNEALNDGENYIQPEWHGLRLGISMHVFF